MTHASEPLADHGRGGWRDALARAALLAFAGLAVLSAPTAAHERWVRHELRSEFDRSLFETLNLRNAAVLALAALGIGVLVRLSARPRSGSRLDVPDAARWRDWAPTCLGVAFGVGLLVSALHGEYLAPDLVAERSFAGSSLTWATLATSVLLVAGLATRWAAVAALGAFAWAVLWRPFEPFDGEPVSLLQVVNYVEVAGVAIYLAIVGRGRLALDRALHAPVPSERSRQLAVGTLRVLLGATLLILGLQKFLVPELPMGVVQNYADQIYEPFHRLLGVSPEFYVFGASIVETSIGMLLVLGACTRPLMIALAVLFSATTFVFEGEVLGHLGLFGVVAALFLEGPGAFRVDRWIVLRDEVEPAREVRSEVEALVASTPKA